MFNFTNCMICFGVRPVEKSAGNVYRLFLGGQGPVYTATRSYKVYKVAKCTKLQSYKITVRGAKLQSYSARCSVKVEFNRVQQRQKELEAKHQHINTSTHQHININSTPRTRMHQHTKYTRETATNTTHKNPSSLPAAMVPCCCSTRGRFNRLYWPSSSRSTF
jgi:hypothetical protein